MDYIDDWIYLIQAELKWVSEWVEFNAPLDTIQVISEAEAELKQAGYII